MSENRSLVQVPFLPAKPFPRGVSLPQYSVPGPVLVTHVHAHTHSSHILSFSFLALFVVDSS